MSMRDRRSVDDLTIEELEQILALRKRQAREATMRRLRGEGRVVDAEAGAQPTLEASNGRSPVSDAMQLDPAASRFRPVEVKPRASRRPRLHLNLRTWRDRFLLLVEVGALVGLVLVIAGIEQTRQELNQDVAAARDLPTPEPTPIISAVVLPSGHKPPDESGFTAPNDDEIPAHLRSVVQSAPPLPIPTPGPGQPTRIVIPALGVDANIVQGTGWEELKKGVGHQPSTGLPGNRGNVVLAAHNDIFGEIFRDLDQLKEGDEIIIYSLTQMYRYEVSGTRIVAPTDVEVMDATHDPTVTLISCYPYLVDNQRIVVFATLES